MKKFFSLTTLSVLLPVLALAAVTKYTFNDVVQADSVVTEVEAVVKSGAKNNNSRCDYFSDNYVSWLGYYQAPVVAGTDAETVKAFCVAHYADRVL